MDHLRRFIPRSPSPILLTTTSITALTALIWLGIRDYRAFIALGPGGMPYNVLGWAGITLLIRPFALSKAQATRTDDYLTTTEQAHEDMIAIPRRRGKRPEVGGIAPHRQLSQHAGEGMREVTDSCICCGGADKFLTTLQFIHNLFANAAVQNPHLLETKVSGYERHNDALFVSATLLAGDDAESRKTLPHAAVASGGEIGHPHPDLSIHLYVSPADARVLIEKGWAERHRMAVPAGSLSTKIPIFSRLGDTFLMIYGPRDEEEMAVLQTVLRNSIRFMTGREGFEDPEWRVRVSR